VHVLLRASRHRRKTHQPVPESYLAADAKSGVPQPPHTNTPRRFSLFSALRAAWSAERRVRQSEQH
jgi:hypothetical protein